MTYMTCNKQDSRPAWQLLVRRWQNSERLMSINTFRYNIMKYYENHWQKCTTEVLHKCMLKSSLFIKAAPNSKFKILGRIRTIYSIIRPNTNSIWIVDASCIMPCFQHSHIQWKFPILTSCNHVKRMTSTKINNTNKHVKLLTLSKPND